MKKTKAKLKLFILLSVFIMALMPSIAQDQGECSVFTREELLNDLNMLWDAMKDHPKLYENTSESSFSNIRQTIQTQFTDRMTANDFLRIAHPLVVSIGCAHSILWPPMKDLSDPQGNTIPLNMTFQKDGAFVLSTFPEGLIPVGSKVLSINDLLIKEIEKKLFSYFPADGLKNLGTKRARAGMMLSILYPKLIEESDTYRISFIPPDSNHSSTVLLEAFGTKYIWEVVKKALEQNPMSLEFKNDSKTAIIKLKTFYFGGNGKGNDEYYAFLEEAFNKIKENHIENLILDLRNNGGGDPVAAARLFSYIARKPVKYFDKCSGYSNLLKPVELAENNFKGNLYTIINGGGFSTAGHIVALIKYHKIGTIVGSELGCTFTCNDSSISLSLKYTGNVARVARQTFTAAVKGMRADQGVLPDYQVVFSVADLISNVDSEIKIIFNLISKNN